MNQNLLVNQFIQNLRNGAQFVSVTYTAKSTGETARYTLLVRQKYIDLLEKSILECEIQLQTASGVQAMALAEQKFSLEKSLEAHNRGEQNEDYTKKGMYNEVVPGINQFKDGTFELKGLQIAKVVLVPGTYTKVNHRNELSAAKAKLRKDLPIGKYKTLCLDLGNLKSVRMNGETVECE
jgi:predicted RNase H-related nuclease YkuK (DUF458 family)